MLNAIWKCYLWGMALTIPPHRPQLISYAVTTGLLLLTSVIIMLNVERIMHPYLRLAVMIVALLGCIMFGYAFLYNLTRVGQSQPFLEANREGLWFNVHFFNHGKVAWDELEGFSVVKYGMSKRILIQVKKPEAFAVKYPGMRKFLFQRNLKRYKTPISLPLGLLGPDAVEHLNKISAYKPEEDSTPAV